ncbi:MAG: DNA polymerase III subunit alpha [Bacteroidaceae bacterium]|nr:DNA polymerase III subunit alpha [Candidatus Equimonas faecalis]MCQ2205875.1 DNA polymerase III subunit alpha [Bacteroidaceae bacterium]
MQDFIHLHVHTQYSLLDGQASIPALINKALKDGMKGMAITDHGNMMGVKEYYNCMKDMRGKAKKAISKAKDVLANPESDAMSREEAENTIKKQQRVLDFRMIFGCEVYVARRKKELKETKEDRSGWHLILLAKNEHGYHNLIRLVSRAWVDGEYMRPRTDHDDLERFHEDIICCTACIAGEVPSKFLHGDEKGAEEAILWHKALFGDDYYLELQRHEVKDPTQHANRETFPLQQRANAFLIEMARKHNVKLVCTNDSHFVDEENAEAHDRLICLSTGRDLNDPKRMVYSKQEWFKTRAEMNQVFADVPEALSNTVEICEKVSEYCIDHAPIMPNFPIPESFGSEEDYRQRLTEKDLFEEFTRDENGNVVLTEEEATAKIEKLGGYDKLYRIKFEADYLAELTYAGARRRYGDPLTDEVAERIKFELHVMKTMGFPGYFLIVQDYIRAAREELGVSVGPGRGSAAGSVVAYCLWITDIDPIKYDLLFERFLNPDRISLPDIDVDFDDDGRGRVLEWVTQKYGAEKVAHIITYSTMATKNSIKDVARVQNLPLSISNNLCKLIPDKLPNGPDGKPLKMNLPNAISVVPELQQAEASADPVLRDTIRYAKMLEGTIRGTGVHACGTIICRDAISDWVPVSTATDKDTDTKVLCTQYDGHVIEETGLIKMDFLGLKTLSQIREVLAVIKQSMGVDVDIDHIDIDDQTTYQLYRDGRTIGTFQFESVGMQKNLRDLQPDCFEDLIAMNALYRPGPMDYIPDFIARKQGRKPVEYDIPIMERYLKDTYGITVYQEQVMLLSRLLANFTRGESDALRKAMGKKKKDIVDKMKPKFIEGGQANGYEPKVLEKIWADWESFASYAFNKSHATCYSWVSYQTAWLKANFPSQFMAGTMSRALDSITDITKLMDECKAMRIPVLGPDINESYSKFSVNHLGSIRFGLAAIKGVGTNVVESIISERTKHGEFTDIYNFMERVSPTQVNRKALESLALAGAFDSFQGICREQFFATVSNTRTTFSEVLINYAQKFQADKAVATASLFGDTEEVEIAKPQPPADYEKWSDLERLSRERELVGVYISGHPLDEYQVIINKVCSLHTDQLENLGPLMNHEVTFAGIVSGVKTGQSAKTGKPYGIVRIEDYTSGGEIRLFGDEWARWANYLQTGYSIFVTARVEPRFRNSSDPDLRIGKIEWLSDVKENIIRNICIDLDIHSLTPELTSELGAEISDNAGKTELRLQLFDHIEGYQTSVRSAKYAVNVNKSFLQFLDSHDLTYHIND